MNTAKFNSLINFRVTEKLYEQLTIDSKKLGICNTKLIRTILFSDIAMPDPKTDGLNKALRSRKVNEPAFHFVALKINDKDERVLRDSASTFKVPLKVFINLKLNVYYNRNYAIELLDDYMSVNYPFKNMFRSKFSQ